MAHVDSDTEDSFSADEGGDGEGDSSPCLVRLSELVESASPLIQASSRDNANSTPKPHPEAVDGEGESTVCAEGGASQMVTPTKKENGGGGGSGNGADAKEEDSGDAEMAPVYLKRLLPIFTEIYQSSLAPSLRKESLRLLRKMTHYVTAQCLQELCQDTPLSDTTHPLFSAQIGEVLAAVLESEDDHEAHLSALNIMQELLSKDRPSFDEQFLRLGLPTKIGALAAPLGEDRTEEQVAREKAEGSKEEESGATCVCSDNKEEVLKEVVSGESQTSKRRRSRSRKIFEKKLEGEEKKEVKDVQEDATEISVLVPYQWREWCIVRSRDCLYLWNSCCVVELSNVSNGWFRFLVDNRLATMYSSGSTEGGPGTYGKGSFHQRFCRHWGLKVLVLLS